MGNKPWTKEELQLVTEHKGTIEELCELLPNRSFNSVRLKFGRLHVGSVENDVATMETKTKTKKENTKYKEALRIIKDQQGKIELITQLKNGVDTYTIKPTPLAHSEATALMVASDWHVEEEVQPKKIQGLNKFTLQEAQLRAEKFFINGLRLINISSKDVDINKVVVALLGDFASGNIHDELLEINQLSPMEAVLFAQKLIISGIEYLIKNSKLHIIVPCVVGNHLRITEKTHISTENENSLEYYMYRNIAQYFENNERVTFVVSDGDVLYMDVYSMKLRFIHGHQIRFGGGVGGLTIPLLKYIQRQDQIIKADLTVLGHFHSQMDGNRFMVNGSLIGYNAYAQRIGASFETPRQAFFLIDRARGKTIVAPIFLE